MKIKRILCVILCGLSLQAYSYTNQCSNLFLNGIQAHTKGIVRLHDNAQMLGGSSNVDAINVRQRKNNLESCGSAQCLATGNAANAFPGYTFQKTKSKALIGTKWFRSGAYTAPEAKHAFVSPFSTLTLTPDNAKFKADMVTVSFASTLVLEPGDYWFKDLIIGKFSRVIASQPGTVKIFAKRIHSSHFSEIGEEDTYKNILLVANKVLLGAFNEAYGAIYAHKRFNSGYASTINGVVSANRLQLMEYSTVNFNSTLANRIDFTWVCDFDQDGIYDGFDEDADNDGFTNEVEELAGSSQYDANDVPSDLDQDGTPDVLDDDIDGDGYTNQEEAEKGTDPNNPNDFPLPEPPVLSLTVASGQTVETDSVLVTGRVVKGDLEIGKLYVSNDSTPDAIQLLSMDSNGNFSHTFSLSEGLNQYTFTVEDIEGTETSAHYKVTYVAPFKLINIEPTSGSTVSNSPITVNVELQSNIEPIVKVNGRAINLASKNESTYLFSGNIEIHPGDNQLEIQAQAGNKSITQVLQVRFEPADMSQYPAPVLMVLSPTSESRTANPSVPLLVNIDSNVGGLKATLNGNSIGVSSNGARGGSIATELNLAEGQNIFTVSVEDALGQRSNSAITIERDTKAPEITIYNRYSLPPTINQVDSRTIAFAGEVRADDLDSVTIQGQQIELEAGVNGTYTFDETIQIDANVDSTIVIEVTDTLGNTKTLNYFFHALIQLEMQWISPTFPAQWFTENAQGRPFAIRLLEATGDETIAVVLNTPSGQSVTQSIENVSSILVGSITGVEEKGQYSLVATATINGNKVSELVGNFQVMSMEDVPVEIVDLTPMHGAIHQETDQFLQIDFNRPIDPTKVQLEVRRTIHGLTYENFTAPGEDFLHAKGYELVEVNENRQLINGGLSLLPGDSSIVFYPEQEFGYNALVEWRVSYDGKELAKQKFTTRDLPTIIQGGVIDSLGQKLQGITVEIPELGLRTQTNSDGGFAFGYGLSGEKNIAGGRYGMVINKGATTLGLGEISIPLDIKQGARNKLRTSRVPNVSNQIQWNYIPNNINEIMVGNGDVKLNLQGGTLRFPTEQRSIHTQFIPSSAAVRPVYPGSAPLWYYQVQPFGIQPSGPIHIEMNAPRLNGSLDYLGLAEGEKGYSLLLGYSSEKNILEPVGVLEIEAGVLRTVKPVSLETLDYMGYTHTRFEYQEEFKKYMAGELNFIELVARITVE